MKVDFEICIMRYGVAIYVAFLLVLSACQDSPVKVEELAAVQAPLSRASVSLITFPPGGQILLEETGETFADGGVAYLVPGSYTLTGSKSGYRGNSVNVSLENQENRVIEVPLGTGYAELSINVLPQDAAISINGQEIGSGPYRAEIDEGVYTLDLLHPDYFSKQETVRIVPGTPAVYDFELEQKPTQGPLMLHTEPDGGEIFFQGKLVGEGQVDLGLVGFGGYTLRAVKTIDGQTRLVGFSTVMVDSPQQTRIVILMEQREHLFEGAWMPASLAKQKEKMRYLAQRVVNPISLDVDLGPQAYRMLQTKKGLAQHLMAIFRVGDQMRLHSGEGSWEIWKRHSELTNEFSSSVDAFQRQKTRAASWILDTASKDRLGNVQIEEEKNVLAELAIALHRLRANHAILDLKKGQLSNGGESVYRSLKDGPLTLVAMGGDALEFGEAQTYRADSLLLAKFSRSDQPLKIDWTQSPLALLVISNRSVSLREQENLLTLKSQEKKIRPLISGLKVVSLDQLSNGPDYEGWRRERFVAQGPFSSQIDLSKAEIGPNYKPGTYYRTWIITYDEHGVFTQRQLATEYRVGEEIKDFEADKFLRRGRLSRDKEKALSQ
ncbi:MAG: PEGA domain-containing protein [Gammaproteobacteria bacterium]|nr:PEGA domain-containing protein [Gammaproteobacteria bacterium]